jgi:probable HAF family extracellular repeat protein
MAIRCGLIGYVSALVVIVVSQATFAAPGDFIDLGTLGGSASEAWAVNGNGVVVGSASIAGIGVHAFKHPGTAGGVMVDLGTLGAASEARGINDAGAVVGESNPGQSVPVHAFKHPGTPGSSMFDLGTLGGLQSIARGINAGGVVVGESHTLSANHAFIHPGTMNGTMFDLGTLGGSNSRGFDINASGAVVGIAQILGNAERAFKHPGTPGGAMQNLGSLGGFSGAAAINSAGVVVGFSYLSGSPDRHAFRHAGTADGVMEDLGTLPGGFESYATDINDGGAMVGQSSTSSAPGGPAVLWRSDKSIVNLDAWLDLMNPIEGAKWTLYIACSINNSGMVAGIGNYRSSPGALDYSRGFLLNASSLIPEPSSLALVLIPTFASARRKRS